MRTILHAKKKIKPITVGENEGVRTEDGKARGTRGAESGGEGGGCVEHSTL